MSCLFIIHIVRNVTTNSRAFHSKTICNYDENVLYHITKSVPCKKKDTKIWNLQPIFYTRCTQNDHLEPLRWRQYGALQVLFGGVLNGMPWISTISRPVRHIETQLLFSHSKCWKGACRVLLLQHLQAFEQLHLCIPSLCISPHVRQQWKEAPPRSGYNISNHLS